jgi:hypothetical protein
MVIQIRIVINVPKSAEEKFSDIIEDVVAFIIRQFPEYKTTSHSPVIVTIDKFDKLEKHL